MAPSSQPVEEPVAVCAGLLKIYVSATGETHALRGVDARFARGTVTAVTGPSGSGKSSLLGVLALQERASGGELTVLGRPVGGLSGRAVTSLRRRHVSWVAQRPSHSLFPRLTAAQQLRQVAGLRGDDPRTPVQALDELGLAPLAGSRPGELSGGEQQRLAVAVATWGAPDLLVADEPTAELDDESAVLVLEQLHRAAAAGSAVVLSTHDARAVGAADRVLALRHGVLSTERDRGGRVTAPIDSTGRLQLPADALELFPGGRALVERDGDGLRLRPVAEGDR
ncbi:putative ABC transport system ATP-binding protein [Motilibacter peucedani]|uniref:Putative ABC transport system ATP-binding protein n=1 Tax=Motilibacter peucedani TaxID=598650 RepID=A0A420XQE3_9ACTN|nr:ATP-binding cassette domain-containing protein [Motilibacter peucedani]RKS75521.1 putative ABC transport system ATP-binding protein [Motilibacter peucedani]